MNKDKNEQQKIRPHIITDEINGSSLLIIDDDDDLRNLVVRKFMKKGFNVDDAHDVSVAKQKLLNNKYDLIILDLMMIPESGYVLFQFLIDNPQLKWISLIVLSGSSDVNDKIKCLELGADDYVTKPFQFEEVNARVCRILTRAKEFEQLAFYDPLTGVFNRRYLENQMMIEIQRLERIPANMCIAVFDIDRFKLVNDRFGHSVGDIILQGLTAAVKKQLRQSDLLARYGGEEFIIFMPNTNEEDATLILERILKEIRQLPLAKVGNENITITFSAGVAQYEADMTIKEWVDRTDQLLYLAKDKGRNRVINWTASKL